MKIIDLIVEMDCIQSLLGLSTIPHFTTLQKFLARIKSRNLGFIFAKTLKLFYSHDDEYLLLPLIHLGLRAHMQVIITQNQIFSPKTKFRGRSQNEKIL